MEREPASLKSAVPCEKNGVAYPLRDETWDAEVQWHIIRAITERANRSYIVNLVGWCFCALVTTALSYRMDFILPLAMRLVSLIATQLTGLHLIKRLNAHEPYEGALRNFGFALSFGGFTWALMLWPILQSTGFEPPIVSIVLIMVAAVSLTTATMGSIPRLLASFLIPFVTTTLIAAVLAPSSVHVPLMLWSFIAVPVIVIAMTAYSLACASEQVAVAEMLVENRQLSEELASALSHAEFLLQRDPLTGLFNRRAFFDLPSCLEQPESRFLLAIDLDHFKQVNDRFGHDTGDKVLIATADAMREITYELPSGPHTAVRLGGEEFAMVLCGLDRATATAAAEALRHRVLRIVTEIAIPGLQTSASIGITEYKAEESLDAALHRADLAMYRAKRNGRNRVILEAA